MKAASFQYELPEDLNTALQLLNSSDIDVLPLAGGQSLMPMMNFRVSQPDLLVDLNKIDSLKKIDSDSNSIKIGSMVKYSDMEKSDLIKEKIPLINNVIPFVAHSAIRNRGTIGGSIALADPAAEFPSLLVSLDATIELMNIKGTREVKSEDFFTGIFETDRKTNELVTSINIPINKSPKKFGFYEITRRHGDYAMAGAFVTTDGDKKEFSNSRVVLFAVSTKPLRIIDIEVFLNGNLLNDVSVQEDAIDIINGYEFEGDLHNDTEAKKTYAKVSLKRALGELNG
jgi:aerobic carbon-monoxide dehydrogenase medium subunit